jgi:hypothetical protein
MILFFSGHFVFHSSIFQLVQVVLLMNNNMKPSTTASLSYTTASSNHPWTKVLISTQSG